LTSCTCNAGFSGPDGGTCSACVAGKYKALRGTATCSNCGTGTYSTAVGASASSTCSACPSNSNSPEGSSALTNCTLTHCTAGWTWTESSSQWVQGVTAFSSEYTSSDWGVIQLLGQPNVYPSYGDNILAWSPRVKNSGIEYLKLNFATSVVVSAVEVYETSGAGSCVKIQLLGDLDGLLNSGSTQCWWECGQGPCAYCGTGMCCRKGYVGNGCDGTTGLDADHSCVAGARNDTVWQGPKTLQSSFTTARIFAPQLQLRAYRTRTIRLEIDTTGNTEWYNIDAVKLIGPDGGCTACVAGKYKASTGSANCSDCPTNSNSPEGSSAFTNCTCNAGWTGPEGYLQYRLVPVVFRGPDSYQVTEFRFFDMQTSQITPTSATNPGGDNPTPPTYPNEQGPGKMIDEDTTTKFLDFNKQPAEFQFSSQVVLASYEWVTGDDALDRDMLSWRLEGRKTAAGAWTTLHSISNYPTTQDRKQVVGRFNIPCAACMPGKYKASTGSAPCTECPSNSHSPEGSSTESSCTCDSGFSGPAGGPCTAG
jgi:hypothetical protein